MAVFVQYELKLDKPANRMREEPSRPAAWDKNVRQPARYTASFGSASRNVQAEYWVGSDHISVRTAENNFYATLGNLHKGIGASVGWVLLADTLGGGMIFLSITGVILWTQLNRRRMVGSILAAVSIVLTITFAGQMI